MAQIFGFKIDLIVWKCGYMSDFNFKSDEFKIDLIVWKLISPFAKSSCEIV